MCSWDDWVPEERLRKRTPENVDVMKDLTDAVKAAEQPAKKGAAKRKSGAGLSSDQGSVRDSEDRGSVTRGTKRGREWEIEKVSGEADEPLTTNEAYERAFNLTQLGPDEVNRLTNGEQRELYLSRPAIRIPLNDSLKRLLVDDWENVTKNLLLIPIPHPKPISQLLADYEAVERPRRPEYSAGWEILDEIVSGLKEYFDNALGRMLLYRFERLQYLEIYCRINGEDFEHIAHETGTGSASKAAKKGLHRGKAKPPNTGGSQEDDGGADGDEGDGIPKRPCVAKDPDILHKTPSELYGVEHLCRLFCSMPEMIAQTNMDTQSVNRLREELSRLTHFISRRAETYFVKAYIDPGPEYHRRAQVSYGNQKP